MEGKCMEMRNSYEKVMGEGIAEYETEQISERCGILFAAERRTGWQKREESLLTGEGACGSAGGRE